MKIADKIKTLIMGVAAVSTLAIAASAAPSTYALAGDKYIGGGSDGVNPDSAGLSTGSLMDTITVIINVILGLIGLIAVVMIIMGGFNYVMSQGDPGKVKKAKDTILYGVIGLIVALLAYAIINFVLTNVFA